MCVFNVAIFVLNTSNLLELNVTANVRISLTEKFTKLTYMYCELWHPSICTMIFYVVINKLICVYYFTIPVCCISMYPFHIAIEKWKAGSENFFSFSGKIFKQLKTPPITFTEVDLWNSYKKHSDAFFLGPIFI